MTEQAVEPEWVDRAKGFAMDFAKGSEGLFRQQIQLASSEIKDKNNDSLKRLRGIFLDAATATFALIIRGSFNGISLELEEQAVKILREKIREMRTQEFQSKVLGGKPK